jgi:hypothetical protein
VDWRRWYNFYSHSILLFCLSYIHPRSERCKFLEFVCAKLTNFVLTYNISSISHLSWCSIIKSYNVWWRSQKQQTHNGSLGLHLYLACHRRACANLREVDFNIPLDRCPDSIYLDVNGCHRTRRHHPEVGWIDILQAPCFWFLKNSL